MLTADLVQAYRRGDKLMIRKLDKRAEASALDFARVYLATARRHLNASKADFDAACKAVPVHVRDKKLSAGLLKLVQDRCTFEMDGEVDAVALRQAVFRAASHMRQSAELTETFDRRALLETAGASLNLSADDVDRLLFSDLKSAHRMIAFDDTTPEQLLAGFGRAQEQAVLLKAYRVTVRVKPASAPLFRVFFHRLKFLRLLHTIYPEPNGVYRIDIDGPFSLFTAITKYGFQLAQLLPALDNIGSWTLDAEVVWGKERRNCRFQLKGGALEPTSELEEMALLSEDVQRLVTRFQALGADWEVAPSTDILEVPGAGLTIPDLVFTHQKTGDVVYLEVMGFWSRDAVWKRIELVEAGLNQPVIFAVSKRLRVSEAALDDNLPSSLYVYKGVMNAARIQEKLDEKILPINA